MCKYVILKAENKVIGSIGLHDRKPNDSLTASDYIKFQDSIFYQDNKDIVELELDFLQDTLPVNNVWSIAWSWFENNEKYPKESVIGGTW